MPLDRKVANATLRKTLLAKLEAERQLSEEGIAGNERDARADAYVEAHSRHQDALVQSEEIRP